MGEATKAPTTILIFASEPAPLTPSAPAPTRLDTLLAARTSRTHHPASVQLRVGTAAHIRQIRALAPDCPPTPPLFRQSHSQTRTRHGKIRLRRIVLAKAVLTMHLDAFNCAPVAAIAAECSAEQADGKHNPLDALAFDHALILSFTSDAAGGAQERLYVQRTSCGM